MKRQVRTRKYCRPSSGTHFLESPDGETSQGTERMRTSEGHSRTGEPRQRDRSGHRNNVSQRGALTYWRAQTERQVRHEGHEEPKSARGTHLLENQDGETSQGTDRMTQNEDK
jgi:hypothetical protein